VRRGETSGTTESLLFGAGVARGLFAAEMGVDAMAGADSPRAACLSAVRWDRLCSVAGVAATGGKRVFWADAADALFAEALITAETKTNCK
jgi:hypothetical protein